MFCWDAYLSHVNMYRTAGSISRPLHCGHIMFLFRASFLTVPLYRSSNVTAIWWATSLPLGGPLWARECGLMPKNMSKISIGLCISLAMPPSLIAFSPPRSYNSRFFGSVKTSYAWEIALNCWTVNNKDMLCSLTTISTFCTCMQL